MRVVIVGFGTQGRKRLVAAGDDVVATVDLAGNGSDYNFVSDVPLSNFEAALVCTPDQEKFKIIEYLLSNGKHVLVEKPLLHPENTELVRLQELAAANRIACYTAYNHRFEPNILRMKQVVDQNEIGQIYHGRFLYGNGTAANVRNSPWKDQDTGVLGDLGSHLLDLVLFLFDKKYWKFELWTANRFENQAWDHVVVGGEGRPLLELEATFLSWRNTFRIDLVGELGSAHVDCLCKWGPSTFCLRRRVFPSGKPSEESDRVEERDKTWEVEYAHFKDLCESGESNLANDIWINSILNTLTVEEAHCW